ncbi:serine--tRNA ligase, mitochondrial isoform X3 [Monomorium pharaonis]|uniref:serine--tRNA ligase, mitochondrial isoform X3 n=1 Tax=Monomorium pharaonis TaxID=307658 RepID=UPI0017470218|nr:serine--tRNA ligase, mitochondrial isoform X3 [Monomorium pharaonis]
MRFNLQQSFKFCRLRHFWLHTLPTEALKDNATIDTRLLLPEPEYNTNFLCNPANRDIIFNNIKRRKGVGDIDKVLEYSNNPEKQELFLQELSKIPNCTHPAVVEYGNEPRLLKECGRKPEFVFEPKEFGELASNLKAIRTNTLGPITGQRSYILLGDLAELEEALIQYSLKRLMEHGFKLLTVPDIILTKIIEKCGLIVDDGRTLVYNLNPYYGGNYSLSGTAEMSLASKLMNTVLSYDMLPMKLAAVSRCYRAEGSGTLDERGIYRVHQFTKVEMFVCSEPNQSEEVFQDLQKIQEELFSSLGLHFRIMDMPSIDLGSPAYRVSYTPEKSLLFLNTSQLSNIIPPEQTFHAMKHLRTKLRQWVPWLWNNVENATWKAGCPEESCMVNCPVVVIVRIINRDVSILDIR